MRLFVSVIATTAMFFAASVAGAATTFSASTSTSGASLSALQVGDTVTIDVTLSSDGTGVFGLGVSAIGYSPALSFTSGQAAGSVLNQVCIAPSTCFGGLDNTESSIAETTSNVPGLPEVQLFSGISVSGSSQTGALDQDYTGGLGTTGPQFQIVFTAANEGSTTISLGANVAYGDNVVAAGGALANDANTNAEITLTVPEPATMASSLAALGSVLGVVAIRRRA
jgi:hypothetical protein